MGGNALKNTNCVRVNKELYDKIKSLILYKLSCYSFSVVFELPEKDSFGDLDLIYEYKQGMNIRDIVNELFSPKETFSNGDILSFSYQINETDYFQIDLIKVPNINMAQFYFAYGDIGLILGRILKKNNLTFGHEGLFINYENEKIVLTSNPEVIASFLNLDYQQWLSGFDKKIDINKWIVQCKFFQKDYFNPEKFNHEYKKNLEKRPFFREFVDYILKNDMMIHSDKVTILNESITPSVLDYIEIFGKQSEKELIDQKIQIIRLYQEKFNGHMFLQYTDPRNINKLKEEFKTYITQTRDFNDWLRNNSIDYINEQIKEFIL